MIGSKAWVSCCLTISSIVLAGMGAGLVVGIRGLRAALNKRWISSSPTKLVSEIGSVRISGISLRVLRLLFRLTGPNSLRPTATPRNKEIESARIEMMTEAVVENWASRACKAPSQRADAGTRNLEK